MTTNSESYIQFSIILANQKNYLIKPSKNLKNEKISNGSRMTRYSEYIENVTASRKH